MDYTFGVGTSTDNQTSQVIVPVPAHSHAEYPISTEELKVEGAMDLCDDDEDMEDGFEDDNGMWVSAFKAGVQTDSEGVARKWATEDITKIANQYNKGTSKDNPVRHVAPVVIGHPEHNSPAWGWVDKAKAVGQKLYLHLNELQPEFVDLLKRGMYKTRSISLYPDLNIRHIGFLGGAVPAVKGLGPFKFDASAEKFTTYNFEEDGMSDLETLRKENKFFKKLFKIFKVDTKAFAEQSTTTGVMPEGATMAEPVKPVEAVVEPVTTVVETVKTEVVEHAETAVVEPVKTEVVETVKESTDVTKFQEELTNLKNENALLKTENENLKTAAVEEQKQNVLGQYKEFCQALVTEGRMRPVDVDQAVLNLKSRATLQEVETLCYTEGKSKVAPADYVAEYKNYLSAQPKTLEDLTKEIIVGASPTQALADDFVETKISEAMKANKNIQYHEALTIVSREFPDKVQAYIENSMSQ